jgi:hypothetical protein
MRDSRHVPLAEIYPSNELLWLPGRLDTQFRMLDMSLAQSQSVFHDQPNPETQIHPN